MKKSILIHPNTPTRLAELYKKLGSMHKVADARGVNIRYVQKLITRGEAPSDRTPKLRKIRRRLYLQSTTRARKPKSIMLRVPHDFDAAVWKKEFEAAIIKSIKKVSA